MISIIIPVLNEVDTIGNLLHHITQNASASNISEIIVVDGGSIDGTLNIISDFVTSSNSKQREELNREANKNVLDTKFQKRNFTRTDVQLCSDVIDTERSADFQNQSKILLINSKKGRAKQMNLGAKHATGSILYFLHADSFPPKNFDQLIINEVNKGNKAGCFRLQFDSNHWWLQLASWFTQFSWRACRGGDQSQFITKTLFNDIGGYDENYIIYEDNILINELYARNEYVVINKKIKTSARLYRKHGVWTLQYHFWTIYVKKWLGASADDLLAYYKKYVC
ncbi:TIGR04283 family arsenosugar biosynthesis glycosyltransferase [Winogradskyella sediminis]|uniref:Transferase 2, rSAM/selenodomain-associated n=1 Tax=Winogradskyella sediminis TaxID=1382466 RepID=A0A1H1QBZ4_9FLAO|nr:TIGR04283 family arsenosugar biosynthesis glycosyltransferase [Winogradskyella sediminis]SDS21061.1 transferase 2, rSAM/selenodomain-associated [Winogradskyella sediminis]